jgi:transposase InsO family protein
MVEQFPFRILGFHSDNGSEFVNAAVAKLLGKLLIEQTKSRPRQSNDNALVETKNGAVIRKHIGYSHIRSQYAEPIQRFYDEYFNPYLNLHRPCAQPELVVDQKGRTRRIYRRYQTPLETLLSLPQPAQYLRAGYTLDTLKHMAAASSDTEAARRMQEAKRKLFDQFASTS